jgi:hypothetical protein
MDVGARRKMYCAANTSEVGRTKHNVTVIGLYCNGSGDL